MGRYRDKVRTCSAAMPDLMLGEFCDELDARIDAVQVTIQAMQQQIAILDQKVTACCGDSALRNTVSSLRAELEAVRGELANLKPTPTP